MNAKYVLVTGGAGYVGSHACKALKVAGFTPVTYDNMSIGNHWAVKWGPLEIGDILDVNRLAEVYKKFRPVAVMHFAAYALVGESMAEPAKYYRNNVIGTINLLDLCRAFEVKNFVASSTCATYGEPDILPIVEDTPQQPVNPYGASKLMVEQILDDYLMAYKIRYAALRYFNAAGADPDGEIGECRQVETHLIPLVMRAITHKKAIKIMGGDYPTKDGSAVRDYVHVSDLALAHVNALHCLISGHTKIAANLGSGIGMSVKEVVELAGNVSGVNVAIEMHDRRPGDPPALVADIGESKNTLLAGHELRTSEDIVRDAWQWEMKLAKMGLV
ncbi:UDP-glucose 4-epimerase GalE [Chromatiales bacterium (ex Bugula neritina AB1)]|nr:UDP-glucose 4-epimerase GalE [Chromatiales bacterium (ex Bugula neritina AB1)]